MFVTDPDVSAWHFAFWHFASRKWESCQSGAQFRGHSSSAALSLGTTGPSKIGPKIWEIQIPTLWLMHFSKPFFEYVEPYHVMTSFWSDVMCPWVLEHDLQLPRAFSFHLAQSRHLLDQSTWLTLIILRSQRAAWSLRICRLTPNDGPALEHLCTNSTAIPAMTCQESHQNRTKKWCKSMNIHEDSNSIRTRLKLIVGSSVFQCMAEKQVLLRNAERRICRIGLWKKKHCSVR